MITIRDTYLLPGMDDCVASLGKESWFSTLDGNLGYWKVPIAEKKQDKTTFAGLSGTTRFWRMPDGLINASAALWHTVDILLNEFHCQMCIIYLDEEIVLSKLFDTHFKILDTVLSKQKNTDVPSTWKSAIVRRHKNSWQSQQQCTITGGTNGWGSFCWKQAREWRKPWKNLKKILLRGSCLWKRPYGLGVWCSYGKNFTDPITGGASWPQI